ncbi:hypothetical protein FUA26_09950 [Seonamhaeicola algicola]|uniref:Glycine dehydrogenase n=1 Tax=Seonamhaeicola algicola TaxID=1719036 RepID=A0A5C7AVL9_9FLAO|nr:hypothetical protein [Seonamhaeicola algicola]TXE09802.1 hypothetical protein FUA26_09950 [Seonamhaeicola algicola]
MKKSFLFVSCDEAQHLCDKAQYNEASLFDKIKLNLRLSWCRVTRAYYKRNTKLTKKINEANVDCLTPECKENMKKELEKAIKNQAS